MQKSGISLTRTHIGFILVAASYILLVPIFLFLAMAVGGKAWLWCRLAGATYVFSWVLFIAGFLMAGPDTARSARLWIGKALKHKHRIKHNCSEEDEVHQD